MTKAGQTMGQTRDAAEPVVPRFRTPVRGPDERVVLASERSAVWDRPVPTVEPPPVPVTPLGPVPTTWTPDLVHCRLVAVNAACFALPRINWPAGYRSIMAQWHPRLSTGRPRVLSAQDMDRIDWTLERVCAWPEDDQMLLRCFMSGRSFRETAEELKRLRSHGIGMGKAIGKSSVPRRYRALLITMAAQWNEVDEPIDADTRRVWLSAGKNI